MTRSKSSKKTTAKTKATSKSKSKSKSKVAPSKWRQRGQWAFKILGSLTLFGVVGAILYTAYLDIIIREQFEGKRWALPARVYAQPLELYVGKAISREQIATELNAANYRVASNGQNQAGTYIQRGNTFNITTRAFQYWDGEEQSANYQIKLANGQIERIQANGQAGAVMRIDPVQIAAIYPNHQEDRDLVKLDDVPVPLVKALIITEDRAFYEHHGVRPLSIARAMVRNIKAGRMVEGGSTLTQQLVKNYFLTHERTLGRKGIEAWMSLILEARYDKNEILEAYLNEVFLGQDGDRAIHGFGLASQFYFDRPLNDLTTAQQALLVGMVKGATYYNPRRFPKRVKTRRDLVLKLMHQFEMIDKAEYDAAVAEPVAVVVKPKSQRNRYLDFLQLVKRQLKQDYKQKDLNSEGLRIFTTLSVHAQAAMEQSVDQHTGRLSNKALQIAGVLSDSQTGEVLALMGGRSKNNVGFNRALDARRPMGSLVKPAVYLTALMQPEQYHAATILLDEPFEYKDERNQIWSPANYDHKTRGELPLYQALINSYNIPTARLGMEIGVPKVSRTLKQLGLEGNWNNYPSVLLGTIERSPYDIAQMMQTLAGQGTYTRLKAVRAVVTAQGERLQRYPLEVQERIPGNAVYVINSLMQKVVTNGTARRVGARLPHLSAAGKTGTTDDGRDAWFAGFTGSHLAVFWLGNDDNSPTGYAGSSGALPMWLGLFERLPSQPLSMNKPSDVVWHGINAQNEVVGDHCKSHTELPFIKQGDFPKVIDCDSDDGGKKGFFGRMFDW